MEQKPTALFIGRFQPFHNGHMLVIQGMAKVCKKIVIAIGSSDKHDADNPWTAEQRKDMIQRALQARDIIPMFDVVFIEVPDQKSDHDWATHVLELAGPVDVLWSGNKDTQECFEGKLEIKNIVEVPGISSTKIRELMAKNDWTWQDYVPEAVASAINDFKRNQD
jgi:nicotinamide-nucleotide adenylyltransferase